MTYTDDGRKFYTVKPHSFYNDYVTLTDTHTGFELHMSRARFERAFRALEAA